MRVLPANVESVLDLGSGAGIPGIPIKLARLTTRLVLVESRRRRASFLSAAIRELALEDVRLINTRAEEIQERIDVDAVVMRCAGRVGDLLAIAKRLARPGGIILIAGPPETQATDLGRWVQVPNPIDGRARHFLVSERA